MPLPSRRGEWGTGPGKVSGGSFHQGRAGNETERESCGGGLRAGGSLPEVTPLPGAAGAGSPKSLAKHTESGIGFGNFRYGVVLCWLFVCWVFF